MTTTTEGLRDDIGPVFGFFLAYVKWADYFAEKTGRLAAWVVLPTVAVGFINVVLRYVGQFFEVKLTSNAIIELQWYLYSLIFLLGFAYVLRHQINVRVDFWFANQPTKRKAWIDFAGHLIALVPFAVMGIWVSLPQSIQSIRVWEGSPDASGLPRGPIKLMLAIAFVLLLLQAIAEQAKLYAIITGRGHLVHVEHEHEAPIRVE
jgi:TRAP-type mannitol/chloroaromatic compound transport system permease small subunit